MTREEAIEILRHYDDLVWQGEKKVTMGMIAEAIYMGEVALSPWRSVKEELPKHLQSVIACSVNLNGSINRIDIERYDDYVKCWVGTILFPDYWFPIPDLPKEKEEQK